MYGKEAVNQMKKVKTILLSLLMLPTVIFPICAIILAFLGYNLIPVSALAFSVVTAMLAVCSLVFSLVIKDGCNNKVDKVLIWIITPFSFISSIVFSLYGIENITVMVSGIVTTGFCSIMAIMNLKKLLHKILMTVIITLAIIILCVMNFGMWAISQDNSMYTIETVDSPSGRYYAEVNLFDYETLGGRTFVDVHEVCDVELLIFTVEKGIQCVYDENYEKNENLRIHWKDDTCLVINAKEYKIK